MLTVSVISPEAVLFEGTTESVVAPARHGCVETRHLAQHRAHRVEVGQVLRRGRLFAVLHHALLINHERRARRHRAQPDEVAEQHAAGKEPARVDLADAARDTPARTQSTLKNDTKNSILALSRTCRSTFALKVEPLPVLISLSCFRKSWKRSAPGPATSSPIARWDMEATHSNSCSVSAPPVV